MRIGVLAYIIVYYSFSIIVFGNSDNTGDILFFPMGFYRALADIFIGLFCYTIAEGISGKITKIHLMWIAPLMILEYVFNMVLPKTRFDYLDIIIFAVSIVFTSKMEFKRCNVISIFSKYTYPIYCYQVLSFWMIEFIYRHITFIAQLQSELRLIIDIASCIVIGVLCDVFLNLLKKTVQEIQRNFMQPQKI